MFKNTYFKVYNLNTPPLQLLPEINKIPPLPPMQLKKAQTASFWIDFAKISQYG